MMAPERVSLAKKRWGRMARARKVVAETAAERERVTLGLEANGPVGSDRVDEGGREEGKGKGSKRRVVEGRRQQG